MGFLPKLQTNGRATRLVPIRCAAATVWRITVVELFDDFLILFEYLMWACFLSRLTEGSWKFAAVFSLALIAGKVAQFGFRLRSAETVADSAARFKGSVRTDLFKRLFRAGPRSVDGHRGGELVTALWEKVEWLGFFYLEFLPRTFAALIVSIGIIAWLCTISRAAGLVLAASCVGLFVVPMPVAAFMCSALSVWFDVSQLFVAFGLVTIACYLALQRTNRLRALD